MRFVWLTVTLVLALFPAVPEYSAEAQEKQPYTPGLGEFMTAIQLRHAKLWFAGDAKNWELADYQLDELKEVLEDAAKLNPTYKNLPIEAKIKANMEKPLADLAKAVEAKDNSARFHQDKAADSTSAHQPRLCTRVEVDARLSRTHHYHCPQASDEVVARENLGQV